MAGAAMLARECRIPNDGPPGAGFRAAVENAAAEGPARVGPAARRVRGGALPRPSRSASFSESSSYGLAAGRDFKFDAVNFFWLFLFLPFSFEV